MELIQIISYSLYIVGILLIIVLAISFISSKFKTKEIHQKTKDLVPYFIPKKSIKIDKKKLSTIELLKFYWDGK